MPQSSRLRFHFLVAAVAAPGLGFPIVNHANAAVTTFYFDMNGTSAGSGVTEGSTYNWEDTAWTTSAAGTGTPIAWTDAQFPVFGAGTTAGNTVSYTITVGSNHTIAGMQLAYNSTTSPLYEGGKTVTVNGPGVLTLASGLQGVLVSNSAQTLTVNATLAGTGGVTNTGSGSLNLYGNNTYSGGTQFGSAAGMNFNNNNSFGTGPISFYSGSTGVLADDAATSPIILPNAVQTKAGGTIIYVGPAAAPVTFNGNWTLASSGNSTLTVGNGTHTSTKMTIAGVISGASTANFIVNGTTGTLVLSVANTYTGTTTLGGTTRLVLGAHSTISKTSQLILSGGTLDPDGFDQDMHLATLGLTANSTIDFANGAAELDFANSSAVSWTGTTLNLVNWNPAVDKIRFDSSSAGLTAAQLAKIEFNGAGLGTAVLDANGYLVVPEPASLSLVGLGAAAVLARRRRA